MESLGRMMFLFLKQLNLSGVPFLKEVFTESPIYKHLL